MRVAYDITFLANNFFRANCKTGIFRVAEEVLLELSKRSDIDLAMVGLGNGNPFINSLLSTNYVKGRKELRHSYYLETMTSRFGLEEHYRRFYGALFLDKVYKIQTGTVSSLLLWATIRMLTYLQRIDLSQTITSNFDIYHSPFLRLPPRNVTGNISRVLTVYDLIPLVAPEYANFRFNLFFRRILNSIDKDRDYVICISEYTKRELCEYTNMSTGRVFVTPLAAADYFYPVDDAQRIIACRKRYGIPAGNYFLTLAALQPRKNITHLIRCFVRFIQECKKTDISLVLVGSLGWKFSEILKTVEHLSEFKNKIIFTGYVPDEDLSSIYSGARAFFYPSLSEGFGLPPLEAMQCGVPVVSSNTTSLPEVVGEAGIMVNPTDENELCQAMLDIVDNDQLWHKLRAKGLERAAQFSWSKCAAETVNVYKKASGN